MEVKGLEFEDELIEICKKYGDGSWEEPLDGDEVDKLVEHLRNQLNAINGNITQEEYEQLEEHKTMTSERVNTVLFNAVNLLSDDYDDFELVEALGIDFDELEEIRK